LLGTNQSPSTRSPTAEVESDAIPSNGHAPQATDQEDEESEDYSNDDFSESKSQGSSSPKKSMEGTHSSPNEPTHAPDQAAGSASSEDGNDYDDDEFDEEDENGGDKFEEDESVSILTSRHSPNKHTVSSRSVDSSRSGGSLQDATGITSTGVQGISQRSIKQRNMKLLSIPVAGGSIGHMVQTTRSAGGRTALSLSDSGSEGGGRGK